MDLPTDVMIDSKITQRELLADSKPYHNSIPVPSKCTNIIIQYSEPLACSAPIS